MIPFLPTSPQAFTSSVLALKGWVRGDVAAPSSHATAQGGELTTSCHGPEDGGVSGRAS